MGVVRSCRWDSFSVDIAWLRNVLFTGKTLSPSVNWESIHGCSKRCPLGECGQLLRLGECGPLSVGAVKLCHFHTSRCRMTLLFPVQRVNSSFNSLQPKAFEHIWGRLPRVSSGKILKDQKFPNTGPHSRRSLVSDCFVSYHMARPPPSLVLWIEACLYKWSLRHNYF